MRNVLAILKRDFIRLFKAPAAIVVVLGLVTALLRYNAIKTYTQYDVVSATETSGDNIADYSVFAGNVLKVTKDGASYIDEKGVTISQDGEEALLEWKQVYKVVDTKSNLLVYSTRVNAYVFPKRELGEHYEGVCNIMKQQLESYRLKIK